MSEAKRAALVPRMNILYVCIQAALYGIDNPRVQYLIGRQAEIAARENDLARAKLVEALA